MYKIGDKIVYPAHGAGKIVGIETKEVLGETKEYFQLKMPIGNIMISVPIDRIHAMGIRECISKEDGKKLRQVLESEVTEMPQNWSQRFRENQEIIKSGDIYQIAEVVRNLMHLDNEKGLSTGETKMLNSAKRLIVSELVLVGGMSPEEAEQMIDESVTLEEDEA